METKLSIIILDFDGVIVESVGIKDQAFEVLYEDYSDQLEEIMNYHLSHNATIRFEKFRYISENILKQKYSSEMNDQLSQKFSELIINNIIKCPFVSGAIEFLNCFLDNIPIYLISMSPQNELHNILEARNLKQYFKKVYTYPWIKSNAIQDILDIEKLLPQEAIFIGDTPEDFYSAKKTNISFIGRTSTKCFPTQDIPIFSDLFEIKSYLTGHFIEKQNS